MNHRKGHLLTTATQELQETLQKDKKGMKTSRRVSPCVATVGDICISSGDGLAMYRPRIAAQWVRGRAYASTGSGMGRSKLQPSCKQKASKN